MGERVPMVSANHINNNKTIILLLLSQRSIACLRWLDMLDIYSKYLHNGAMHLSIHRENIYRRLSDLMTLVIIKREEI